MSSEVPGWVDDGSLGWAPEPIASRPAPQAEAEIRPDPEPRQETALRRLVIPGPWLSRLGLGVGQGFLFFVLFYTRGAGAWPGSDPFLFAALVLPGLFVPLLLIEGLGLIAARRLLPFAVIVAGILAGLGWYHRWRIDGVDVMHAAGLWLIGLCAVALFIAQAVLHGRERGGSWRIAYPDLFAASWTLTARLLIGGILTAIGLGLLQLTFGLEEANPFSLVLLGLVSALSFQLTAALPFFTNAVKDVLVATATLALPLLTVAAMLLISIALADSPGPLPLLLVTMVGLVIAISASHRGGEMVDRRASRDDFEIFGAAMLLVLAWMAVGMLDARVSPLGWTMARLFAACAVALLAAYAVGYSFAAIAWLVRSDGMRWLERVNRVLGAVLFLGCIALASPLADPWRLSVTSQAKRLEQGLVAVEAFDFANLERDGARFGRDALADLSRSLYPDIARAASSVRGAVSDGLNPTGSGANIAVRTPGAVLPATLLARDWSQVLGVPACLNTASEICDAYFRDLNGDGRSEILLVSGSETRWWAAVMQADEAGRWSLAGRLSSGCGATLSDLRNGRFSVLPALAGWGELSVGGKRLAVTSSDAGCSRF